MRRMSETQTMTQQQQQGARLAIAELRTVKWVASQPLVKQVYDAAKPRYLTLKQAAIIGWFIILYEVILVWWWTFIHNLPLPVMVLSLLQQADSLTVRVLDFSQQRLEWVSGQVLHFFRPYMNRLSVDGLFNKNQRE